MRAAGVDDLTGRHLTRLAVLLLVEEKASHGYELLARLEPLGVDRSNPGRVYRALRWLADAGLVDQEWETTGAGPARRRFSIAARGLGLLDVEGLALRTAIAEAAVAGPMATYCRGHLTKRRSSATPIRLDVIVALDVRTTPGGDPMASAARLVGRTLAPGVRCVDVRQRSEL